MNRLMSPSEQRKWYASYIGYDIFDNLIQFHCLACKKDFAHDVGQIHFKKELFKIEPCFEKNIICPTCGIETSKELKGFENTFRLTTLGQSKLTELLLIDQKMTDEVCEHRKNIGRNDSCYCGSGKKYKKCCLKDDE